MSTGGSIEKRSDLCLGKRCLNLRLKIWRKLISRATHSFYTLRIQFTSPRSLTLFLGLAVSFIWGSCFPLPSGYGRPSHDGYYRWFGFGHWFTQTKNEGSTLFGNRRSPIRPPSSQLPSEASAGANG